MRTTNRRRSCLKTRTSERGFTLIEIMVALAIVAGVIVILLDQRLKATQDALRIRDQRLGWTLAAWKMSAIELDDTLLAGPNESDAGTFEEYSSDYSGFVWEYEAAREKIYPDGENNPEGKTREVFRVLLKVR